MVRKHVIMYRCIDLGCAVCVNVACSVRSALSGQLDWKSAIQVQSIYHGVPHSTLYTYMI